MKKVIVLCFNVLFVFMLHGQIQVLESNKRSTWGTLDENKIIFSDEKGNDLIEIEAFFRRNKTIKRQVKLMKINGKEYQIVLENLRQAIYEKDGPLVATIDWSGGTVHFVEEDIIFKRKIKTFKGIEFYEDEEGEKIVVCEPIKKRKFRLSVLKEVTNYSALLMALSYHQFIEEQKCLLGINETIFPCLSFTD